MTIYIVYMVIDKGQIVPNEIAVLMGKLAGDCWEGGGERVVLFMSTVIHSL